MSYEITIRRRAQKELSQLPSSEFERAVIAIQKLSENPRPPGSTKLAGRDGWRIRFGNYRIIYDIDDANESVDIVHIGHRRDVYR